MKSKISVSVMCSDLMNLEKDIHILERNGVDYLHVDIMDAHFVPNLAFGVDFIHAMHHVSKLPLDIHLMVEHPEEIIKMMDLQSNDIVSVHVELIDKIENIAVGLKNRGIHFGLAVNPETPIENILPYISFVDVVILMLVHPGFAHAKMIDGIMNKVASTRDFLDTHDGQNIEISVDGSVSCERGSIMRKMGASIFVGGTAGIYRKGMSLDDTISAYRAAIS